MHVWPNAMHPPDPVEAEVLPVPLPLELVVAPLLALEEPPEPPLPPAPVSSPHANRPSATATPTSPWVFMVAQCISVGILEDS
jgi:hypothetical protein